MDRKIAPRISPEIFAITSSGNTLVTVVIVQRPFSTHFALLAPFSYLKAAIGVSRYRYDTLRGIRTKEEWRGWVVLGRLHRPLRPFASVVLSFPSFFFSLPTVFTLLQPKRVECSSHDRINGTCPVYISCLLRLDLILRDHYVGRHRQVLRHVLVLAGIVAVALRVFSVVRLILLRLLLHGTVR